MYSLKAKFLLFSIIRMFFLFVVKKDEKVEVRFLLFRYKLTIYLKLLL